MVMTNTNLETENMFSTPYVGAKNNIAPLDLAKAGGNQYVPPSSVSTISEDLLAQNKPVEASEDRTFGEGLSAIFGGKKEKPSSLDMQSELAEIQALSQGFQGNNIGATVGTGVGAVAGGFLGPGGSAAGAAVGGGIGSIVDYMMDSNDKERIARKQADLKRKLIRKQQRKSNANAIAERKARLKGIGLSLQEEAMTAEQAIKNERKATLANLMYDIGQKNSFRNQMNTNFKAQRGLV